MERLGAVKGSWELKNKKQKY